MALDPSNPLTFAASFEDTVKIFINYRLFLHKTPSNASASLATYAEPFLNHFIYLHRNTHSTPSSILVKISSTLTSKCGLTYPYNSPENWVFFASSSSSSSSALTMQPTEMTNIWPFIPMRLGYDNGVPFMSVEIGNRLGPPPLEVLLGWFVDSGVADKEDRDKGKMDIKGMIEYRDMCWQERVTDAKSMTPYITIKCKLYHEVPMAAGRAQQEQVDKTTGLGSFITTGNATRVDHHGFKDVVSFISLASIPELAEGHANRLPSSMPEAGVVANIEAKNDIGGDQLGNANSFKTEKDDGLRSYRDRSTAIGLEPVHEEEEKHDTDDQSILPSKIKLKLKTP